MKKTIIIHPFLFALFPILFLFAYNIGQVSFSEILLPSAIVLGFTAIALILLWLVLKRDIKKAAVIVSTFLILFFSYGRIFDLIQEWQIGSFVIGRYRYLMIVWAILFIIGVYYTVRTRKDLHNFTNVLNVIAICLVIISLVNIGIYEFKTRGAVVNNLDKKYSEISTSKDNAVYPDIYYIILDGYASSDTLNEVFGYDNHEFIDYLSDKGFYIAKESKSNYAITFLSLASSLNMDYINYLSDTLGKEPDDRRVPYQMIKNNKVMNFLKSKGYKFINFSSGWGPTNDNQYADLNITFSGLDEFQTELIQTSMLDAFANKYFLRDSAREKILNAFSKLAEIYKIKEKKFIFAHIISPHPPYLFDANGGIVEGAEVNIADDWTQKENYINQLIFINKKVKILVDEILSKSEVPPIIILQADHGPASTFSSHDLVEKKNNLTENMLKERMGIFNAYFLPSDGDNILYDSITPVNTFRLIFNYYFKTNYDLLNDKIYFSNGVYPYDFTDVTDLVSGKS
jgi:hypothetical protein